jgi:hypothetical protein
MTGNLNGTNYTFTGTTFGNIITLSGSASGTTVNWAGYHDATGTYIGTPNSILIGGESNANGGGYIGEGSGLLTAVQQQLSESLWWIFVGSISKDQTSAQHVFLL